MATSGEAASKDVERKLDLSLDEIVQDSSKRKKVGHNKAKDGPNSGGRGGGASSVFSRLGRANGGRGGRSGGGKTTKSDGWRRHMQILSDEETGDTLVRLYETDVMRITDTDIILATGGFKGAVTLACMNESLEPYGFKVSTIGDEWYASDGRFRLIRFIEDGVTITGGATEYAPDAGSVGTGPARLVKERQVGQKRFRPY